MRTNEAESRGESGSNLRRRPVWIVTQAIDCPYCMGHCEMNWEVARLTRSQIAERSQLLAGSDWSSFLPEEQRAFASPPDRIRAVAHRNGS